MGSGFRTWVNGEVVTDANVQNYLQDQSVMTFANNAAITATITSPEEGMIAHAQDVDLYWSYTGAAWREIMYTGNWPSFTPVWSAVSGTTTVGNGSLVGRYIALGALIMFQIRFDWGTTTTQSVVTADWRFDGPNYAGDNALGATFWTVSAWALDTSSGQRYTCAGQIDTSVTPPRTQTLLADWFAGGGQMDGQQPFTWTTGDRLNITGVYSRS